MDVATLVKMELTEPILMCSASHLLSWGGEDYLALGDLGTIQEIDDSPGENKSIQFTLNGVKPELLSIALAEPVRGKVVTVRMAIVHPDTHAVIDAPVVWRGTLDQMSVTMNQTTSTVNVTAEHRGATFARPKPVRYTNVDQQKLYPGDTSLQYITSQANHQDVWPAASFFKI